MPIGSDRARASYGVLVLLLIFLFGLSLCIGVDQIEFYTPVEVVQCYVLRIRIAISEVFGGHGGFIVPDNTEILAQQPHYYQITERFAVSAITVVCGGLLALSGAIYQLAFRNPVAAPTMLGVSNGVRLGLLIVVLQYGTNARYMMESYYLYAFAASLALLLVIFGIAKLMAPHGRSINIIDILLVGTIASSFLSAAITYVQDYVLTLTEYEIYQNISEALTVTVTPMTGILLVLVIMVTVVPVFLCRFSFNVLSMSDEEARYLGMRASWMRTIAITLATIMIIVSQILVGTVSMVCLIVPHIGRACFGADFSKQVSANMLIGAILLIACRILCSIIPFTGYGLPLGIVVSLVVLPAFVWVIALQQRTWVVD